MTKLLENYIPDSLIFDMDGTLWDATDSYAKIWNVCSQRLCIDINVAKDDLLRYMGLPIDVIFAELFKKNPDIPMEKYLMTLDKLENEMMPTLGGILFPGVAEGIKTLSHKYKLFMLSNCGSGGLKNFIEYNKFGDYITGTATFGETRLAKSMNLKQLMEKYSLSQPVYVGDTQGDCDETHKAGLPFAYMTYGFGTCNNAEYIFNDFKSFVEYFNKLK